MAERAHDELRAAFLDGRFYPHQHLIEMELVEELGVNRAAVREALARLEQEGLVERRANRGVVVRSMSPQETLDVLDMRIALETLAVAWACERQTEDQHRRLELLLDDLVSQSDVGDVAGFAARQGEIHHLLLDMAHAPRLASMIKTLSAQTAQTRRQSLGTPGRLPHSLDEHRRIVQAVLSADPITAASEMEVHLKNVKSSALR